MRTRQNGPALERFSKSYRVDPITGCWVWVGRVNENGYGEFSDKRSIRAHRWSYEHFVGPIPKGLVIDHLYRNRACVNPSPEHLEVVTYRINNLRGFSPNMIAANTNICKRGHSYENNTYLSYKGRTCKACRRYRYERSKFTKAA
jgi:HNH endonuclease